MNAVHPGISSTQQVVSNHHVLRYRNPSCVRCLGYATIVIGVLSVFFGIISRAATFGWWTHVAFGIWGGLLFIAAGALGVVTVKNPKNRCFAGWHLCLMIFATCLAFIDGMIYCIILAFLNDCERRMDHNDNLTWEEIRTCKHESKGTGVAINAILLLLTLVQWLIAFSASIYGCRAVCCRENCCEETVVTAQQQRVFVIASASVGHVGYPSAYTIGSRYPHQHIQQPPPALGQQVMYAGSGYPQPVMYTSHVVQPGYITQGFSGSHQPPPQTPPPAYVAVLPGGVM